MRNLFNLLIFSLLAILMTVSCDSDSKAIGKAGKTTVTLKEFKDILEKRFPRRPISEISYEEKEKILTDYLNDRLKIMKAEELGLDKDPELMELVNQRRKRILASKYPEILITDKLVTREMVQAYKELQNYKIRLEVVALGYRDSEITKSDRSLDLTLALAEQLYERIRGGDSTSAVSAIYSDNATVKNSRGSFTDYRPAMFDPEADIHISKASAPQLMRPFATDGGVYIVELKEKTRKEEVKTSDANDTQIKWQIYNKFYGQLGDSLHNKYSKEFAEHYNSEISDEGIAQFIAEIQNWSDEMPTNDDSFPEDKRDIYLAKIGDQKITSGSFINEFQGQFYRNYRRVDTEQKLKNVLTDYVERYLAWIKKAEEAGIDEEPEIKQAITEVRESQLLDKFNRSQIQDLATVTTEEMDSYYEKNKEMYTIPEKLKIWEIVVRDENLAKEIYQKASKPGGDFEALAREYSISESTKKRGGSVGYLTREASRPFIEQAYEAGADQIIGPIKDNDLFYIIKTGDLLPSKVRTRQELEPSLRTAASKEKADSIQAKILEDLKAENKFWINEKLLKNMN